MMAVEKLGDMEAAFVDIEMDIPGLEVWSTGLPDFCFRIQAFDFLLVADELLPVILSKPGKSDLCHTKRPPSKK